jgi:hypothetical protein
MGCDYSRDLRPTKWGSGSSCTAAILSRPCPLWVKSGHRNGSAECPLYPRKRTLGLRTLGRCSTTPSAGFPKPTKLFPQSDSSGGTGTNAQCWVLPSRCVKRRYGGVNARKRNCSGGVSATCCDVYRNRGKNFRPQKQTCTSKDGGCLADTGQTSREE